MRYQYYLIVIVGCLLACRNNLEEERIKPELKNLSEFVYASVNIIPDLRYQIRSARSGVIDKIYVEEGDKVTKGQPLFSISPTADMNNRIRNANVNMKEAESNLLGRNNRLKNVELQIQKTQEQNQIDSINYERRKILWNDNIGSQSELEQTQLKYNSSTNALKLLKIEYQQALSILENNVLKAKDLFNTEQSLLDDLVLRSQLDGTMFKVLKRVGEFISPQENFGDIGNTNSFIVEMSIDEVDIAKITIGDTAIIVLEAYPDSVYTSTVSFVSGVKDKVTQTFLVEGIFVDTPSMLLSGLSGEANILIDRRKDAMIIPSEYLIDKNKVLTTDGEVVVSVGIKNLEYVELISGVDTSTILLKPVD